MGKWEESTGYSQAVTAFIACSKTKRSWECPAQDLYQGALFRKALNFTKSNFEITVILSAKYGILRLDEIIKPYNKTLYEMAHNERTKWYAMVSKQMKNFNLKKPFVFFAGKMYCDPFEGFKPLSHLGIGQQLKWFNQQSKKSVIRGLNL